MSYEELGVRLDNFTRELTIGLRDRFKVLSTRLNGHERPTAEQITTCILESGADAQRYSPDYLEEWTFMDLIEPLREHPGLGESIRPFYDAVKNGDKKD